MPSINDIAEMARSAQRLLHDTACMERALAQRGLLTKCARTAIANTRAIHHSRLAVAAEHYAALAPANDAAFNPEAPVLA